MATARAWIQARVPEDNETREVREIMRVWARLRATPRHIRRAIRLYDALLSGNISQFLALLADFFPGVALAQHFAPSRPESVPVQPVQKLVIQQEKRDVDSLMAEAGDDFGFGDMEF